MKGPSTWRMGYWRRTGLFFIDAALCIVYDPLQRTNRLGTASTKITPKLIREHIRDALLDQIARGELRPGERIIESRLVSRFGVSSTPVREAIRELVAMGTLLAENHKGASVREVKVVETIEAFRIRASLEALAAQTAVSALRKQQLCPELHHSASLIVESARRRDFVAFQAHNQTFHRTIVSASGNAMLLQIWDSLAFQIRTRFTMEYLIAVDPTAVAEEHLSILDEIERDSAAGASALLASHSNHLVEYLSQQLAAEGSSPPDSPASPLHSRGGATEAVSRSPSR